MNESVWNSVLAEIEVSVSHASFVTWFRNTALQEDGDDHLAGLGVLLQALVDLVGRGAAGLNLDVGDADRVDQRFEIFRVGGHVHLVSAWGNFARSQGSRICSISASAIPPEDGGGAVTTSQPSYSKRSGSRSFTR